MCTVCRLLCSVEGVKCVWETGEDKKKYEIVSGTKDICTNKRTGKVTRLIKDLRGTFEFRHTPQQHKVPSEMGLLFRPLRSSHCATPALGDCHLRFKIFVGTSDGS